MLHYTELEQEPPTVEQGGTRPPEGACARGAGEQGSTRRQGRRRCVVCLCVHPCKQHRDTHAAVSPPTHAALPRALPPRHTFRLAECRQGGVPGRHRHLPPRPAPGAARPHLHPRGAALCSAGLVPGVGCPLCCTCLLLRCLPAIAAAVAAWPDCCALSWPLDPPCPSCCLRAASLHLHPSSSLSCLRRAA